MKKRFKPNREEVKEQKKIIRTERRIFLNMLIIKLSGFSDWRENFIRLRHKYRKIPIKYRPKNLKQTYLFIIKNIVSHE